jgi:hypothetical protein
LSEINKEKEKCEQVWCITCKTEGHQKEECPTFAQYMDIGEPNPLVGGVGYCEICKTWGNHPTACLLLQKYHSMPRNLFCNFYKFVGHDKKYFHALDLMRDLTS